MEIFEVHITGSSNIHAIAGRLQHKTIAIDLLRPDGKFLREENMTSLIMRYDGENNFLKCKKQIEEIAECYEKKGVEIYRVKIESPIYDRYIHQSLYMESHFPAKDFSLPISRNQKKLTFLATDRTYDQKEYDVFAKMYANAELELCLHDTFVEEDKDWMGLWNK